MRATEGRTAASRHSPRARWSTFLRWSLIILTAVFLAFAVADARDDAATVQWPSRARVGTAVLLCLAMIACSAASWDLVMRGRGSRSGLLRSFVAGQLAKYVPGGIAQVLSQAGLAVAAGATRTQAVTGLALHSVVGVIAPSFTFVGLWCLLESPFPTWVRVGAGLASLVASAGFVARPGLSALGRLVHERLRIAEAWQVPGWRTLVEVYALGLAALVTLCTAFAVLAGAPADLTEVSGTALAYGVAFFVGFLAIPVPSGLGVREGTLLAVSASPQVSPLTALAAAACLRAVQLVCELLVALPVFGSALWHRRREAGRAPDPRFSRDAEDDSTKE